MFRRPEGTLRGYLLNARMRRAGRREHTSGDLPPADVTGNDKQVSCRAEIPARPQNTVEEVDELPVPNKFIPNFPRTAETVQIPAAIN